MGQIVQIILRAIWNPVSFFEPCSSFRNTEATWLCQAGVFYRSLGMSWQVYRDLAPQPPNPASCLSFFRSSNGFIHSLGDLARMCINLHPTTEGVLPLTSYGPFQATEPLFPPLQNEDAVRGLETSSPTVKRTRKVLPKLRHRHRNKEGKEKTTGGGDTVMVVLLTEPTEHLPGTVLNLETALPFLFSFLFLLFLYFLKYCYNYG